MNFTKKIEEIRNQPENIRLRYVWGSVAISMLFIVIIWVLSLKANRTNFNKNKSESVCSLKENCFESVNISNQLQSDSQEQIKF